MKGIHRLLALLLVFSLTLSFAFAVLEDSHMKIYAVTSADEGLAADLTVQIKPGSGDIYSKITHSSLGATTQVAERTSVDVARNYFRDVDQYDYYFGISSPAYHVEGPSAGAAMTLLVVSMLLNKPLPGNVSITGTIALDGSIGQVGGVFHKAEKASETGIDLFLIPAGEGQQIVPISGQIENINLPRYALEKWGLKVIEVSTFDELMEYAFSDIEAIDINAVGENEITIFTPEAVEPLPQLEPMKELTQNYLSEAEETIESAKTALNGTLLEDQEMINALLVSLNDSQRSLSEAKLLFERNYLYSSANYAFVSLVNAGLVKNIAENPSLLAQGSTVLDLKISSLKSNVDSLKEELSQTVPLDRLEWHIAAQQRLVYAFNNLEKLTATETLIVDIDQGGIANNYAQALSRLEDYEFAKGWYEAAKQMHEIAQESDRLIDAQKLSEDLFIESIDQFMVETENGMAVLEEDQLEDIQRRLEAAKTEKWFGWNLAALTDAASALALVKGALEEKELEGLDAQSILTHISSRVESLDANIAASEFTFVWPQLYLDHAKYYQRSAQHYHGKNQSLRAKSLLKNSTDLVFMAEHVFVVTEEMHQYFSGMDLTDLLIEKPEVKPSATAELDKFLAAIGSTSSFFLLVVGLLIGAAAATLVSKVVFEKIKRAHLEPIAFQIQHNKALQKHLELDFAAGRVTRQDYEKLKGQYLEERETLERQRIERAKKVLMLDELNNQFLSALHLLRDVKHRFNQGILSEAEYKRAFQECNNKIARLRGQIGKTKIDLGMAAKKKAKPARRKTGRGSKASGKKQD